MDLPKPITPSPQPTELRPSDRNLRQRELVPPEALAACHAVVIGVGAIGRQVALQLTAVGIPLLILYDHDRVEEVNLASQGYRPDQLSCFKTDATAADCQRLNPQVHVIPSAERFRRSFARQVVVGQSSLIVFACVDSIVTRRLIWEAVKLQAALFVDGRMSAEIIRVLAVDSPASDDFYLSTLFASEEAYAGSCTARSTIYTASVAAGLMVGQMTKWLRRLPVDRDLTLNLLSAELMTAG
jgi:sulfur carrier protein ThiS adenylyltransferase